jgi:hypothetical protein
MLIFIIIILVDHVHTNLLLTYTLVVSLTSWADKHTAFNLRLFIYSHVLPILLFKIGLALLAGSTTNYNFNISLLLFLVGGLNLVSISVS